MVGAIVFLFGERKKKDKVLVTIAYRVCIHAPWVPREAAESLLC